jgi:hypothetical protein
MRGIPAALAAAAVAAAAVGCGPAGASRPDSAVRTAAAAHAASSCRSAVAPQKGDIEPAFPLPRADRPHECAPSR